MTKQITALNTISGQVGLVNASALRHPTFSEYLVEVPEGTKSFAPEKYSPKTADEYRKSIEDRKTQKAEKPESGKAPDTKTPEEVK